MTYNFRNYLLDMKVWEKLHFKNKKAFKNALAVMYGRKKDRSGLKKKIAQIRKEYEEESRLMNLIRASFYRTLPKNLGEYLYE